MERWVGGAQRSMNGKEGMVEGFQRRHSSGWTWAALTNKFSVVIAFFFFLLSFLFILIFRVFPYSYHHFSVFLFLSTFLLFAIFFLLCIFRFSCFFCLQFPLILHLPSFFLISLLCYSSSLPICLPFPFSYHHMSAIFCFYFHRVSLPFIHFFSIPLPISLVCYSLPPFSSILNSHILPFSHVYCLHSWFPVFFRFYRVLSLLSILNFKSYSFLGSFPFLSSCLPCFPTLFSSCYIFFFLYIVPVISSSLSPSPSRYSPPPSPY